MNRINHISKIVSYATKFVLEVQGFNASGLYDINIHAEGFLIPVLNEVFGLRLENLNATQKKNYPAIDLADFKSRVAFQVTSTSDFDKIKTTLEKFKDHKLNAAFDVLYIYIITNKKDRYNDDKLKQYIPDNFVFSTADHVIDKDDLLQRISSLSSTPKIEAIAKIYEHEFSESQIQMREKAFVNGCLNTETETICPNLLPITFPKYMYQAELNIDEDVIIANVNTYLASINKKQIKKLKPGNLVKKALRAVNVKSGEWVLHEKYIYTFKDLEDTSEPFRKIVDIGTITRLLCKEYYEISENTLRVFKHLLRNILMELCKIKEIEWYAQQEVFRFANNQSAPNQKRVKWKGKNEATKTVIFEMQNKKEGHIICFRSLAFKSSFFNIEQNWYLVLNPTWSFTNPGGYDQSRYESAYMSGIKRLESNGSVYNYFRFFSYYFSHRDLFTPSYKYLQIHAAEKLSISPRLEEKAWKPVKIIENKSLQIDIEIKLDNELTDNTLF
ncbi:MAG: SMEK domain-containing protein [Chitinophagaceae bacterium]|nr:SMEK domain-containing protein [Chitinophagaceae bacterium]